MGRHAGFCSGVRHAVELTEAAVSEALSDADSGLIWTLGELIHNPQVLAKLRDMGVRVAESPDDVESGRVIIRSHGVARGVMRDCEKRGLRVIDATCASVKRLHEIVMRESRDRQVFIAGSADHPEVRGTAGWCEGEAAIVLADVEAALAAPMLDKGAIVAQTTIPSPLYKEIVDALRTRVRDLSVHDTVCKATALRQAEAVEIAKWADIMIVVGGKTSSNTKRLAATCALYCGGACHIESSGELTETLERARYLEQTRPGGVKIGITAGASTPDWVIADIMGLVHEFGAQCHGCTHGCTR